MKRIVFTLGFLLLAAAASAQEKYDLKIRLPEGTYTLTRTTTSDEIIQESPKGMFYEDKNVKRHRTLVMKVVVGPTDADGTQKVTMEITRVTAGMEAKHMTDEYDSDDASEEDIRTPSVSEGIVVGMKLTMAYDGDGKMMSVEGWDEFFDKAEKDAPDQWKRRDIIVKRKFYGDSGVFTKMLDRQEELQPPAPVTVGNSWQTQAGYETPMGGKMSQRMDNTLESVETVDGVEIATIRVREISASDGGQVTETEPATENMRAVSVKILEMNREADWLVRVEVKTGLIVSRTAQTKDSMVSETIINKIVVSKSTAKSTGEVCVTMTRE